VAPELRRGLLVDTLPADWLERCRRLGAVALHTNDRYLRRTDVGRACDSGLWVVAYTVNDPLRARTLFEWGVDCVITDRPDLVRAPRAQGLGNGSGDPSLPRPFP
jgi:glycerophosphoryl diester phosphodiesterase